ncbi:MAG: hypothetical protein IT436_10375 [Phycisphaerales bacterium]|nr:hypothetical protein [Phycisphaerales bacterium]
MFEKRHEPVIDRRAFLIRLARAIAIALVLVAVSLTIGVMGYRITEGMNWIDAFYNASFILTGMGPTAPLRTSAGKVFASCYALFSAMIVLTMAAVVVTPLFHRLMHRFHVDEGD